MVNRFPTYEAKVVILKKVEDTDEVTLIAEEKVVLTTRPELVESAAINWVANKNAVKLTDEEYEVLVELQEVDFINGILQPVDAEKAPPTIPG